ncbi:MAG TPA: biotin-dependent carboxyltransferase family protein, partial [Gemmatimonadaceae bacterium]|nr:biotin-dependent carboxyltransferase family protein [Gemmatimonadaceae bacterium]
ITVRQPGIQTTVQDLGRPATQHLGVPVGGPMDRVAHRIANLLVGNDDDAATLECGFGGVALQFRDATLVAMTGRAITASCDGRPVTAWRPFIVQPQELLVLHDGCRTTIAIAGGIDVPVVLGARGTSLRAGFGGFLGRALQRDDVLPVGQPTALGTRIMTRIADAMRVTAAWGAGPALIPPYSASPVLRLIEGPELEGLTAASRHTLLDDTFRVAPESDRMGFRLTGHTLSMQTTREMLSSGVTAGTIQLPPGGAPIVLMADRQTTGGYPRLGDVITVDLPLLAQLRPGDAVRFALTSLAEAQAGLLRQERDITTARAGLKLLLDSAK